MVQNIEYVKFHINYIYIYSAYFYIKNDMTSNFIQPLQEGNGKQITKENPCIFLCSNIVVIPKIENFL